MRETLKNLKRVYDYGKDYKRNLIIFSLMSLSFIAINIIIPIVSAKQLVYITGNLYLELLIASLIVLIINCISAINHWILRKNTQIFFRGTTKNIQMDAAKEILKIEISDIDKQTSGTFIHRINNDTDEMSKIFTRGMGFLTNILTDIGIFIAIFIINKIVFVFYLVSSMILTLIHLLKVRKYNEEDKKYRKQRDKTSGLISELVRGIRDIKMLNAKESYINTIDINVDKLSNKMFDMRNVDMNYSCVALITTAIVQFGLVLLLIYLLTKSYITVSVAIIVYNYKDRVLHNFIEYIGNLLTEIKGFNLSCNRVFSLVEGNEFKKEEFGNNHLSRVNGDFEFKNVYFSYDENEVLKNLSFKVNANETVAFVGKSGSGKTTIFSLLCKLYNINKGEILIDGNDIKDLDEYSIRNNITIISQNPYIFNMSIKDNLKLVKEDLTDEEMKEACKLACLNEFIETLPNKYDTVVGEGGVMLSGGQRQRLAIARAFIQKTEIILFDEATSALDNETQCYIQKAIDNMKKDYTILIIAHRLSTIINADRIIVIDDGKVVGEGTHKQLLSKNKIYKKLYESEIDNS